MAIYTHNGNCINPAMLSDTTPSPFVASCSNSSNSNFAYMAFDHSVSEPWYYNSTADPQWLKIDIGPTKKSIGSYTLTSAANNLGYPGMPKIWAVKGSLDNITWEVVDLRVGEVSWGNNEMRTFTLLKPTIPYRYFMLEMYSKEDSGYGWQLDQVEFIESTMGGYVATRASSRASGGVELVIDDYRIHYFLSSSSLVVEQRTDVEILLVAGGGGGRWSQANTGGGAGGAGGLMQQFGVSLDPGVHPVVVGLGGASGYNGQNTTFNGLMVFGGGYGAGFNAGPASAGGSGGGGAYTQSVGGLGTVGQGHNGGSGTIRLGGGGGGYSSAGLDTAPGVSDYEGYAGNGGQGLVIPYYSPIVPGGGFAGGGGGGTYNSSGVPGQGVHGGGNGSYYTNGTNGQTGTGGGGGGACGNSSAQGGTGGSGIVIIRYIDSFAKCYLHSCMDRINLGRVSGQDNLKLR